VLTELSILDLANNQMTRLNGEILASLTQLKSLKLNNNALTTIDDAAFTDLKLKLLDLSFNHLSSDNFLWPPSIDIEFLNLTFNEYKIINASVLDNILTDFWGKWIVRLVIGMKLSGWRGGGKVDGRWR
jgi:Leucine-rich repeat (LRR) protein